MTKPYTPRGAFDEAIAYSILCGTVSPHHVGGTMKRLMSRERFATTIADLRGSDIQDHPRYIFDVPTAKRGRFNLPPRHPSCIICGKRGVYQDREHKEVIACDLHRSICYR